MTEILLLHGAWHGGWCWQDVATPLLADGHTLTCPTYKGMGRRAAELTPDIGLLEHADEVARWVGDKRGLVACGHSYGGALLRLLEDRLPEAFKAVLYLEGAIPRPGQSILDLNGPAIAAERQRLARSCGDGWRLPIPDPAELWPGLSEPQNTWLKSHMTDHPLKGFTDKQPESPQWAQARHVYVYASDRVPQPYQTIIDDFQDRNWETVAIKGGHELMVTRAEDIAAMLLALCKDQPVASDWG